MIDWLAMMVATVARQINGTSSGGGHSRKKTLLAIGLAPQRDRRLAGIIQHQAGKHDPRPGEADRGFAEMPHVGIQRLGAGNAEEDSAEHGKAAHAVAGEQAQAVKRIERDQHSRLAGDAPNAERADRDKPDQHDRPEGGADARGAERLHGEQQEEDDDGGRHHVMGQRRRRDLKPFERREHGNRRRDGAVAVDQRRAEKARQDDGRTVPPLHAEERHQGQNAALAVIVDAHGDDDVFDRGDQKQRPDQKRQHAENAVRRGVTAENVESRLERVERARADIAEDDAERRRARRRQEPFGRASILPARSLHRVRSRS